MAPFPSLTMRCWPCSSTSNAGLVSNLRRASVVRSAAVSDAMTRTDRAKYIPMASEEDGEAPYQDSPCPIGYGQIISAPHMHAHVLELGYAAVQDVDKPRILDVGAGSGYLTASFGRLVEPKDGRVFGLELLPALVQLARKNLLAADGDLLDRGVASLHYGNGWHGLSSEAPFHFIFVGAAVTTAPKTLLDQLADGGVLVVPMDEPRGGQMLVEITRHGSSFSHRKLMAACFVPLVRGELGRKRLGKLLDVEVPVVKVSSPSYTFRAIR